MKRPNLRAALSWLPHSRRALFNSIALVVTVGAVLVAVSLNPWHPLLAGSEGSPWIAYGCAMLSALGTGYFARRPLMSVGGFGLGLLAQLLAFPIAFVREKIAWLYLAATGFGAVYALYQLSGLSATDPEAGVVWLNLLIGAGGLAVVGILYHLVRHRLAESIACVGVLPLLAVGIYLLTDASEQIDSYNQVMSMKATDEGKEDLTGQVKLLDKSIMAYDQDSQHSQLWRLVFGEVPINIAARAHFHKAVALLQQPNKGKEAFDEATYSLMLNPGNMYSGLTRDEEALWRNDSDQARRLLEKLIRSGQDGGKGMPNQPGTPGEQSPQPGPQRDPNRQPSPGSGRLPNRIL